MAKAPINWKFTIIVDTIILPHLTLNKGNRIVTGDINIHLDNGSDAGTLAQTSATFSIVEFPTEKPRFLHRGMMVRIRASANNTVEVPIFDGYISDLTVSPVRHETLGLGFRTDIVATDMIGFLKTKHFSRADLYGTTMYRNRVSNVITRLHFLMRDELNFPSFNWSSIGDYSTLFSTHFNYEGTGGSWNEMTPANNLFSDTWVVYDEEGGYVTEAFEKVAKALFCRLRVMPTGMRPMLSRMYAGFVYTLPQRAIKELSSFSSTVSDAWTDVRLTTKRNADPNSTETDQNRWFWAPEPNMPGRVIRDFDFTSDVIHSAANVSGTVLYPRFHNSVSREMAYSPRDEYLPSSVTVLVDEWSRHEGVSHVVGALRAIFTNATNSYAIPTLNIPNNTPFTQAFTTSRYLAGVVQSADLTIHPLDAPWHSRVEMTVSLSPGDMRPAPFVYDGTSPPWWTASGSWTEPGGIERFDSTLPSQA